MRFSKLYSGEQILSFRSCLVFYAGDSLSFASIRCFSQCIKINLSIKYGFVLKFLLHSWRVSGLFGHRSASNVGLASCHLYTDSTSARLVSVLRDLLS